ncbi:FecR family protein [Brevundimonas bacteroides]|uniref:FecR family protein n=1 Tax=Brevundimonas bacteroides TaxID=74311 RepID=UPI0004959026|nr:FecR domain-containing protein [Brevundimonas bacteroides]
MSGDKARMEAAEREAAQWHQTLSAPSVSEEALERFFAWRADPVNADAYRRVETVWAATGALAGDADIQQAVSEALNRKRRERAIAFGWTGPGTLAVGLGVAVVLAWSGWSWWSGRGLYETRIGEQRLVQLADGSSVRLDTASVVRVRYAADGRHVELVSGRAFFDVAPDRQRPFEVRAGEASVTAVGTAFEVWRGLEDVEVVLVSGVVDVRGGGSGPVERLEAGEGARLAGSTIETAMADIEAETSWTEGRLVFRDTPLAAAVVEVNRYLPRGVVLEAAGLARTPVTGVFRAGDRAAFTAAVAEAYGLQARERGDGVIVLSSP